MQFSDLLATLEKIDHLAAIELYDGKQLNARIDNKPGSAGSVRVYNTLVQEFGEINVAAAEKGLQLYAEHTADAKAFPGKHPNIDRLLALVKKTTTDLNNRHYEVKLIAQ